MSKLTAVSLTVSLAVVGLVIAAPAGAEDRIEEHLYVDTPDGLSISVSLSRPAGEGQHPVLLEYSPYGFGEWYMPDGPIDHFEPGVDEGVVMAGVSVPGAGCSSGRLGWFSAEQARVGAYIVDWLGSQEWSNGRVVMTGNSYPGHIQYFVAALHPEHLVAINPNHTVSDDYRDLTYAGGIPNHFLFTVWTEYARTANDNNNYPNAVTQDETCRSRAVDYQLHRHYPMTENLEHPYDDEYHRARSPIELVDQIAVPVLMTASWQDGYTKGAAAYLYEAFVADRRDPASGQLTETTILLGTNGRHPHGRQIWAPTVNRFLHRYLFDEANGIDEEPPVQVAFETDATTLEPNFVITGDRWPLAPDGMTPHYLRGDGTITTEPPAGPEADRTYVYPTQPHIRQVAESGGPQLYQVPTPTSLRYDTAPFDDDFLIAGPIEIRFSASITTPDVDFMVTLSEVRPDGSQVYLQKGMLRASHRFEDPARSTPGKPFHPHVISHPVPVLEPQDYAIQIFPLAERFTAGSRLRVEFVAPGAVHDVEGSVSPAQQAPSLVTVHSTPQHPVRLMLPVLEVGDELPAEPDCRSLAGQQCRSPQLANLLAGRGG